jgi:shikimate dehydrogenase
VLGSPIAHSLSPALHRAAYDALGLDGWTYRAIECAAADLYDVLRGLDAEGLAGVSLTMPLKQAVLPLLAGVDPLDPLAAEAAAVNTVLFGDRPGEWRGFNTDVPGMVDALAHIDVPASAVVLGAGATAASALFALGWLGVSSVTVRARRLDAAAELAQAAARRRVAVIGDLVEAPVERTVAAGPWPTTAEDLAAGLVVSTVPAGAADGLAALIGDPTGRVLFDVVYAPWPTPLAAAWAAAGGIVVGGLDLLVAQAAHQVRLMTGREPPIEVMRAAGQAALHA